MFYTLGFFTIVNHYYEPRYDFRLYKQKRRNLKGLNFNEKEQLRILTLFNYGNELLLKPENQTSELGFYFNNGSFPSGDAECYYSIIRRNKPSRIIEVGSGHSTLIAKEAIALNQIEDNTYQCELTCIEPYEMPWLEKLNVNILRQKVEDIDVAFFQKLTYNDILFIDSSHIIRPEGDVLFEILEILPALNTGVWIHFHDIFTPLDYPESWLKEEFRMWNEQYMLEAFLSFNRSFEVAMGMAYLTMNYPEETYRAFPVLAKTKDRIPGSMWIVKNE